MSDPLTVVVSQHWRRKDDEAAFTIRAVAGAASRCGPVAVLEPGPRGRLEPDGAFELEGIGTGEDLRLPARAARAGVVIVDELTPEIEAMLATPAPSRVWYLSTQGTRAMIGRHLRCAPDPASEMPTLDLYVPVNPLAARHRHHGFGFTGYVLVLPDPQAPGMAAEAVRSISARLEDAWVVVVDGAVASAWKGQTLRGEVSVDTRVDLLRLVAHAQCLVDLAPGDFVARECAEALLLGTPIVVPGADGPAAVHANAGGGRVYADLDELTAAVADYQDQGRHAAAAASGRRYANEHYGDPVRAVVSMGNVLALE